MAPSSLWPSVGQPCSLVCVQPHANVLGALHLKARPSDLTGKGHIGSSAPLLPLTYTLNL